MTELKDKIENALNEARILILGGQVLIGFNYRAFFESGFERLSPISQDLLFIGLTGMLMGFGILVAPAPYHRIVEKGKISERLHGFTTRAADIGLFAFALALGADMYFAGEKLGGNTWAAAAGATGFAVAMIGWYGLEVGWRLMHEGAEGGAPATQRSEKDMRNKDKDRTQQPPLKERIKEVLIETRMVLPGAQALMGFQFAIMMMDGFDKAPAVSKYIHFASLSAIALGTIFLIMPAAFHRIVFQGEDNEEFPGLAGGMLLIALFFMGLGMSGDFLVVCQKVTGSFAISAVAAGALQAFFYGLWFGWTGWRRYSPARD